MGLSKLAASRLVEYRPNTIKLWLSCLIKQGLELKLRREGREGDLSLNLMLLENLESPMQQQLQVSICSVVRTWEKWPCRIWEKDARDRSILRSSVANPKPNRLKQLHNRQQALVAQKELIWPNSNWLLNKMTPLILLMNSIYLKPRLIPKTSVHKLRSLSLKMKLSQKKLESNASSSLSIPSNQLTHSK